MYAEFRCPLSRKKVPQNGQGRDTLPNSAKWVSAKCPIFLEFGKVSLPCPFCRIFFRQSGHWNSAKWASKLGKVGRAVVYICKNILFESENIMWGISDECTLALTVAQTIRNLSYLSASSSSSRVTQSPNQYSSHSSCS